MHLQHATVRGRTVCFAAGGDEASDRVLVLVHAFPVGVRMWQPQLDAFPGWRVVAPALPGFDGSDPEPEATIDAFADAVAALATHLGLSKAVFAGVSMGGYVLFALQRKAAHLIHGLVLADTRMGADGDDARAGRQHMIQTLHHGGPSAIANEVIPKLLGPTTSARRPDAPALVRQMIESQQPAGIEAAVRALMTRPDAAAAAAGIRVPTLVVVGEEDVLTPPAEAERLHAAVSGSTLVRLAGVGHLASLEDPDAFNAAVGTFLQTQASGFRPAPAESLPR